MGEDGDKLPQELPKFGPIIVLDGLSELVVNLANAGLRVVGADGRGGRFVHGSRPSIVTAGYQQDSNFART